jgi:serine phosphatase RsbU (regulator of sigma subunit)
LISPVLRAPKWEAPAVGIDEGDHLLLYTDGISESLADEDGRAEERFTRLLARTAGSAALADAILAEIGNELGGQAQADDFTVLAATVLTAN